MSKKTEIIPAILPKDFAELEEKIEATKERRVDKIESDVSALKLGFERIDRNIIRIGERVRAKDLETGDDR